MKTSRILTVGLLGLISIVAHAQSWTSAYEDGLKAARAANWDAARKSFQTAIANRPEDVSLATILPGPPTEQRKWRGGAAYSPNFLAAYCAYKLALAAPPSDSNAWFKTAADELESLVAKKQYSQAAFYFLSQIYAKTNDVERRTALNKSFDAAQGNLSWRVETEVLAPEEISQLQSLSASTANVNAGATKQTNPNPGPTVTTQTNGAATLPLTGTVPYIRTKFALVIANTDSKLPGGAIPHAADDAQLLRDALTSSGGYAPENVDMVMNATADQILKAAEALSQRMPTDATLFLFFTGQGTNINGKDFLAGVDTEIPTDTASMLGKDELYKVFRMKGTSIFAFYQVPRPIKDGRYFGQEVPATGRLAQSNATLPGETINALYRNGKSYGVYADAMSQVLLDTRTNNNFLKEFCWQVFYKTRKGATGGSVRQTPTLPQTVNVDGDRGF